MYSDKDFQTFWFRYKTEGEPHGISINSFCINQGVPYKQFYAWFKKHAKERKDLENEIALFLSDLYSGSKSQQSGRSAEEVGANDGRDDFDGPSRKGRT